MGVDVVVTLRSWKDDQAILMNIDSIFLFENFHHNGNRHHIINDKTLHFVAKHIHCAFKLNPAWCMRQCHVNVNVGSSVVWGFPKPTVNSHMRMYSREKPYAGAL